MRGARMAFEYDVCVVGGCGHVGLPLAITLADAGLRVAIDDVNDASVATVRSGRMPFCESGAEPILQKVLAERLLDVANDRTLISKAEHVVIVIGTPVDEFLNPKYPAIRKFFIDILPLLRADQCIILRSTVYPGTTAKLHEITREVNIDVHVAFCPERVAEGKAMEELRTLPQIVSGCDARAVEMASALFGRIAQKLVHVEPLEAELAKMFSNAWRYIQFAVANQFFMISADYGLDFYRIRDAITQDYPRLASMPGSGFAAGPCLFKDTMQLAAANNNNFNLGHAAMLVNEGLPNFIIRHLKMQQELSSMRIGILGMAFKAEIDDPRESLSYKLRKILQYEAADVLCSDEYIHDPSFITAEQLIDRSQIIILGAPHKRYRTLAIPDDKKVVDIWNFFGNGASLH